MSMVLVRKRIMRPLASNLHFIMKLQHLSSGDSASASGEGPIASPKYSSRINLSPLLDDGSPQLNHYDIKLLDDDSWRVSSGLAHAWQGFHADTVDSFTLEAGDQRLDDDQVEPEGVQDFDVIDNMRIRGNLFYKIDRGSKEFEEYSYDFHRRGASKTNDHKQNAKKEPAKRLEDLHLKEQKKEKKVGRQPVPAIEKQPNVEKNEKSVRLFNKMESPVCGSKKARAPTFNQLTGPYHEPFCLDIYISKASVRACVVHRVTSKVVAVAHSISKDMKFDLGSTRNAAACAAVGEVLAQRALADDIHDVVYTPRKGEKLEGKLQIVVRSIIDSGLKVKVKLKQWRPRKAS